GTIEQAAWLMAYIARGDALVRDLAHVSLAHPEFDEIANPTSIAGNGRLQPRFPSETGAETILGVTGNFQTIGGQNIFGTPSETVARRTIPFMNLVSVDTPTIVPVWFPMVSTGPYSYDPQDTQIPPVMVTCRVEREDVQVGGIYTRRPQPIDGFMPNLSTRTIDFSSYNGTDFTAYSTMTYNNKMYAIYSGNGILHIEAQLGKGQIKSQEFINFINNALPDEVYLQTRYYEIIADAQVEDFMSPGFPFISTSRFHYLVALTQRKLIANNITLADYSTYFDDPKDRSEYVPGHNEVITGASIVPIKANTLYSDPRMHSIFRSRR
ncbi:MAG: hypothetical protein FWC57_02510, partial [Endomicrobia bacterium]|nr:hypothetical protein [Endomicrobiia bacterium]